MSLARQFALNRLNRTLTLELSVLKNQRCLENTAGFRARFDSRIVTLIKQGKRGSLRCCLPFNPARSPAPLGQLS